MKLTLRITGFALMLFCFLGVTNIDVNATSVIEVVVVGDAEVGKTTLIKKLCAYGDRCVSNGNHTQVHRFYNGNKTDFIINFHEINLPIDELEVLPEDHSYNNLLNNSNIGLIVFDLGEGNTISKGIIQRYKEILKIRSPQNLVIFVPNKGNLIASEDERERLGMAIADYAVECERESLYGCKYQDMECIPISEDDDVNILADNLCEKGVLRIRNLNKTFNQIASPNDSIITEGSEIEELKRMIEEKDKNILYVQNKASRKILVLKNEREELKTRLKDLEPKKKSFWRHIFCQ